MTLFRSLILTLLLIVNFPLNSIAEVVFYDTNHIGSPVAMWDKNGKKVWEGEYYPFGEEYRVSKTPQKNKKRFIGKEKDEEAGLTYFGARYMDEKTGRFITPDPVRVVDAFSSTLNSQMLAEPQRLNRYAYSINNPYKYIDPDGRELAVLGSEEFNEEVEKNLEKVESKPNGEELVQNLRESKYLHLVIETKGDTRTAPEKGYAPSNPSGSVVKFNPSRDKIFYDSEFRDCPPFVQLGHELGHSEAIQNGTQVFDEGTQQPGTTPPSEVQSMNRENQIRGEHGINLRSSYC